MTSNLMIAPPWAAARRQGLARLTPWVATLPFYYLLITVAAWRALVEFAMQPQHWNKTAHGVSPSLSEPIQRFVPPTGAMTPPPTFRAEPPLREHQPSTQTPPLSA